MSTPPTDPKVTDRKRPSPEDMERQAAIDARIRDIEVAEGHQSQLAAANMQEYQSYYDLTEPEKNQYFGTQIEDMFTGHIQSGKMATYHGKSVGSKIIESVKDRKEAIELMHVIRQHMEDLQQYYNELAMAQQGKRKKLMEHAATLAAGQAHDKTLMSTEEKEYQALLKEAQKLDDKIALLKFDIAADKAALGDVKAAKAIVAGRMAARGALIVKLKAPGGFAHVPAAKKAAATRRKGAIAARYARHYDNFAQVANGNIPIPPGLAHLNFAPPSHQMNDPESMLSVYNYFDDRLGETQKKFGQEIDQYSSDEQHELTSAIVEFRMYLQLHKALCQSDPAAHPDVVQSFRDEAKNIEQEELLDVEHQCVDAHCNELESEQKVDEELHSDLTKQETQLNQKIDQKEQTLTETVSQRKEVQKRIEANPQHKKQPSPQATAPVAKMSAANKKPEPKPEFKKDFREDLNQLNDIIEATGPTDNADTAKQLDKLIEDFEKKHGDELKWRAKEGPQYFRDVQKELDGAKKFYQYNADPAKAAPTPDNTIGRPGWTFTNRQMEDYTRTNLMETPLSDEFNSAYDASSTENQNEAKSPFSTPRFVPPGFEE